MKTTILTAHTLARQQTLRSLSATHACRRCFFLIVSFGFLSSTEALAQRGFRGGDIWVLVAQCAGRSSRLG